MAARDASAVASRSVNCRSRAMPSRSAVSLADQAGARRISSVANLTTAGDDTRAIAFSTWCRVRR